MHTAGYVFSNSTLRTKTLDKYEILRHFVPLLQDFDMWYFDFIYFWSQVNVRKIEADKILKIEGMHACSCNFAIVRETKIRNKIF